MYVSQARALGAVGRVAEDCASSRRLARALPAAPAPDRRQHRSPCSTRRGALASVDARRSPPAIPRIAEAGRATSPPPRGSGRPLHWRSCRATFARRCSSTRDQLAEQRRSVVATLETLGRRISAELKDGLSKLPQPPIVEVPPPTPPWGWPVARRGTPAARAALVRGALLCARSTQTAPRLARSPTSRRASRGSADREGASGAPTVIAAGQDARPLPSSSSCRTAKPPFDGAGSSGCAHRVRARDRRVSRPDPGRELRRRLLPDRERLRGVLGRRPGPAARQVRAGRQSARRRPFTRATPVRRLRQFHGRASPAHQRRNRCRGDERRSHRPRPVSRTT